MSANSALRGLGRRVSLLALLFTAFAAQAQRGAVTESLDLSQLVNRSETIVRGRIVSARVERHPQYRNIDTVLVTMQVDRVLKGTAGQWFTFRQFIWDLRDRQDGARYKRGQEALVMLTPTSGAGLRAPVGLQQGRFNIVHDRTGKAQAINGHGNTGLFTSAETWSKPLTKLSTKSRAMALQHREGPVELNSLEEVITSVAAAGGGKQ